MLFFQSFQHLLVADSAADFLSAPPVKSCLIAIHSRHFGLLPLGAIQVKLAKNFHGRSKSDQRSKVGISAHPRLEGVPHYFSSSRLGDHKQKPPQIYGIDTSLAFQGNLLNREGVTCCQDVFEVKILSISCLYSSRYSSGGVLFMVATG